MTFQGHTIVVTGGGGGIGRHMTLGLLARGARVAILDVRQEGLDETVGLAGAGGRLSSHLVDVSDRSGVLGAADQVLAEHGSIDGVIHNAGVIQPFARFLDLDDAAIDKVVAVNLFGTIHMASAFLPHLVTRPEARFAAVSSAASFLPLAGQSVYGATKAAVKLLMEGLATELAETGVRVSVVLPGSVATDIAANSGVDMGSRFESDSSRSTAITAQDAARIALDGIEARRPLVLIGRDARFLSVASRVAPGLVTRVVSKRLTDMLP
ncbi:SDR family NAD(P)-dependent oxidoreductase [Brevibacterium album]|uniref:SDR family NAD(P)-dependent oxidoreductase n=1 Tax=Brevibacterium album TaxID=417948 RepID=UPI00040DD02A|nr:SDR family oxidoreductase [Brevibacterium album]